jgi:hypothetical protein
MIANHLSPAFVEATTSGGSVRTSRQQNNTIYIINTTTPHQLTHGAFRMLRIGMRGGRIKRCDTFVFGLKCKSALSGRSNARRLVRMKGFDDCRPSMCFGPRLG